MNKLSAPETISVRQKSPVRIEIIKKVNDQRNI